MKQTLTSSSQLPLDHLSELNGSRLNAAFDYLETITNIAATVCNKEGIVLYQTIVPLIVMVMLLARIFIIVMARKLVL